MVAAELDFQVDSVEGVFVLDSSRAARHGRSHQTWIWELDEASLRTRVGADALVVIEETAHNAKGRHAMLARLCHTFTRFERLSRLDLYDGARSFVFYAAYAQRREPRVRDARWDPLRRFQAHTPCPLAISNLDVPATELQVDGSLSVSGWAFANDVGIESVEMWIDGNPVQGGIYGIARPDVREHFPLSTDPNHPNVGFEGHLDVSDAAPGWHVLAVVARIGDGTREVLRTRRFLVKGSSRSRGF